MATPGPILEEFLEPRSIEETGLHIGFLSDLVLKTIYYAGEYSAQQISEQTHLPFVGVLEPVLDFLKREELVGITGSVGFGERGYRYTISQKGVVRVREALERSQYVGPAPVPLETYQKVVMAQALDNVRVGPEDVRRALAHIVITPEMAERIGPAVNSARSLFLYGPPGNGKTTVASAIPSMIRGDIYVPYAINVGMTVIKVFDSHNHQIVAEEETPGTSGLRDRRRDRRWVKIKRPMVIVGGELTMESLDLIFDPISKTYEAPFQMKANGGVFLIDDFGRQQMRPKDLLNRWIVPLESRVDFLTLETGMKIEIPFRLLIVFSTNLDPKDLVDDAFLRRIRHKLEVGNPSDREFHEIFKRVCQHRRIEYDQQAFVYLLKEYYLKPKRELKSCHPRDILDQIIDIANYRGIRPALTKELIDQACQAYFVVL